MADVPENSSESGDSTAEAPPPTRRRRRPFRWLLKCVAWFAAMTVVFAGVAALGLYLAYQNLSHVVNVALDEFVTAWQIDVGEIDIGDRGLIRVEDLEVRTKSASASDPPLFQANSIELDYDLDELRSERKFQAIRIDSPAVRIDEPFLAATRKPKAPADPGNTDRPPPALKFLGQFTDSLSVTGGKAQLALESMPPVTVGWEVETGPLDFAASDWLTADPVRIHLSELRVGEKGEHLSLGEARIAVKIGSAMNRFEAGTLHLADPLIRVTPATLAAFSAEDDEAKPASNSANRQPEPEVADSAGALAILLEALKIERARFELAEFDSIPDINFETALHWEGMRYENGELELGNGEPLILALENIEINGGESDTSDRLGKIQRLEFEFLPGALIESRRIERIVIDQPTLLWNDATASRISDEVSSVLAKILDPPPDQQEADQKDPATPLQPDADAASTPSFEIGSLAVRGGRFDARDLTAGDMPIPVMAFDLDFESGGFQNGPSGFAPHATQELTIRNLRIDTPGATDDSAKLSVVSADEISGRLDWEGGFQQKRIERVTITNPEINLTDTTVAPWLDLFSGDPGEAKPAKADDPAPASPRPGPPTSVWVVDDLAVTGGILQLDTRAFGAQVPIVKGEFELAHWIPEPKEVEEVEENGEPETKTHPYQAIFRRLRVRSRAVPASEILPEIAQDEKEAGADPDKNRPAIGGLFPGDPAGNGIAAANDSSDSPAKALTERDVGFFKELKVDFTAEGIQREKKIDAVLVDGGVLHIGDGLDHLVNAKPQTARDADAAAGDGAKKEAAPEPADPPRDQPDASPAPAADPAPVPAAPDVANEVVEDRAPDAAPAKVPEIGGWKIGSLGITRSRVQFESLIPEIEGLEFEIETTLTDLPLSGGGIEAQNQTQKIELIGIQIRDPYEGFQPAANLPTIFVEFKLADLLKQRIERIDLIAPELFVGEPFFNWVDYQRNHRRKNEGAGLDITGAAKPIEPGQPKDDGKNWEIGEIKATGGRIIIAPVGYPLGVVPFPFEATTNMKDGKIEFELAIPDYDHVYRFPDLKLDLYGLDGKVEFNKKNEEATPGDGGEKPNNLVLTFGLKQAVWKKYEAKGLFLSVSFDEEIVHGVFGGNAYEGYAQGEFNLYLKDLGKWDAWIAGTDMDMAPITEALTPKQFSMDGIVNCKLVSEGKGLDFEETWGDVEAVTPGTINVSKLDDVIETLPDDWSLMQSSSVKVALETLKDFDYDKARGDLYFVGQDGWLQLKLSGPNGSRNINFQAHDWRNNNNTADKKVNTAAAESTNPEETSQDGLISE